MRRGDYLDHPLAAYLSSGTRARGVVLRRRGAPVPTGWYEKPPRSFKNR